MDTQPDPAEPPPSWIADLQASVAEIARGEAVPLQPVLDGMQAAIARIEARTPGAHNCGA